MSTALRDAVQRLALARAATAAVKVVYDDRFAQFKLEHAELIASLDMAKQAEAEADAEVRALAMAAHTASGDKAPAGGVTIKLFTRLRYDAARAFQWAKEKGMCLIPESLDVKAFEKVAGVTPIDFVTTEQEPQVQIAKDLTAYLPADEPPTREPVTSVESQVFIATGEKPRRTRKPRATAATPAAPTRARDQYDDEDPFA